MAASTGAYVLADRGTWLSFKNRGDLTVLVEGDTRLFNQYGVIVVNPARAPQAPVKRTRLKLAFENVVSVKVAPVFPGEKTAEPVKMWSPALKRYYYVSNA